MKSLKKFKNEINICSRCGLCQAVCPVYQITKNDCTSPRGKFILINEIFKNHRKPSNKFKNYMTMCINCGKCVSYCPSKIDTPKIKEAFCKDYPYFKIKFQGLPFLIRYIFNFACKIFQKKTILLPDKKTVYLMDFGEKEIPDEIKKVNYIVLECGIPVRFMLSNPDLYKELAKISAKKIMESNPDIILTKSSLCRTELQTGLKLIKSGIKIHYTD